MKTRFFLPAGAVMLFLALPELFSAAKSTSDLMPPVRRQKTVELAQFLTRPPTPASVPADLPNPFNPVDFSLPDPEEVKAAQSAPRVEQARTPGVAAATLKPAGPTGDRETLEVLAGKLVPGGVFIVGGKPLLIIGKNRFEVGTKFGVTYNNQDYELELVAIDRTTFTLRYRGEEITRPIKPAR
jgi:hypothetical protein